MSPVTSNGTVAAPVRWGIVGTANIARAQFLPALREAGGAAAAVAGRDTGRTQHYARDNGIDRAITGYQQLIEDPAVDALYIALPNSLHAQWTLAALAAGKPVLCEKPLCGALLDTFRVLEAARATGTLLWEAFVFPFHRQIEHIHKLVADGAIGDLMEITSSFHFQLSNPGNVRYSRELEGGALNDVGSTRGRLPAPPRSPAAGCRRRARWCAAAPASARRQPGAGPAGPPANPGGPGHPRRPGAAARPRRPRQPPCFPAR